tara:strand:- start:757 stop:981 length:225 start_codon:yes stop_codon:yes gene_type:complete
MSDLAEGFDEGELGERIYELKKHATKTPFFQSSIAVKLTDDAVNERLTRYADAAEDLIAYQVREHDHLLKERFD